MRDRKHILKELHRHLHDIVQEGEDGMAVVIKRGDAFLACVVSWGLGWDHVSIHVEGTVGPAYRCPTWAEMEFIKHIFWAGDECAVQYHPPASRHINTHNTCLHIWKPQEVEIPQPPLNFV